MKTIVPAVLLSLTASSAALAADNDLTALIEAAKKEGQVYSVGMPDTWANWKGTWQDLEKTYGLKHQDTDMSSAQEIAKFAAEKIMLPQILAMSAPPLALLPYRKALPNLINQPHGHKSLIGQKIKKAIGHWLIRAPLLS